MIIYIEPGQRTEVPADTDFSVRAASSFSAGELSSAQSSGGLLLRLRDANGVEVDLIGQAEGTDILWAVEETALSPGEWTLNPRMVVSGKVRRWVRPAILIVKDPNDPGAEFCEC